MGRLIVFFLFIFVISSLIRGCEEKTYPVLEPIKKLDEEKEVLARIFFDEPISREKFIAWVKERPNDVEVVETKFAYKNGIDLASCSYSNEDAIEYNSELDPDSDFDKTDKLIGIEYVLVWTSKKFFYEELVYGEGFFAERIDNVEYTEIETTEEQPVIASWIPRHIEMNDEITLFLSFDEYNDFQGFPYLDIIVEIDQPFYDKFICSWISNFPGAYFVGIEDTNKFRLRINTREIKKDEALYLLDIKLENSEVPMNINSMSVTFDLVSNGSCRFKDGETVCSYNIKHSSFLAESSRSLTHGGKKRLPDIKYLF